MGEVRGSIPLRAYQRRPKLILEHLRVIRSDSGEITTELIEIKQRVGFLEGQCANL